ncbi:MAG: sigma-70 family RNA polymerase sigma factor [Oscillospiraceae bacterium]|nr:sigma-70 family RNA polymerase sigma factor [Oscillospiraceae bacterium]
MDDSGIIKLYWERSEDAIQATDAKYGKLCRYIAGNILNNSQDTEECVNDTYHAVWNAIPSKRPSVFSAFIGKIARNHALKKLEYISAAKRNPDAVTSLSELEECVSGRDSVESELETKRIERALTEFLWNQDRDKRIIFVRRYWHFESITTISKMFGYSESKVTSMLHQTRQKLRTYLESEGIEI